jgi:carboxypeptidase family protein
MDYELEVGMMRVLQTVTVMIAGLLLAATTAFAQASITGVVRDASGAVLPGVTVEAASDALIEKVRSGVTDGGGQYRIVDLPPGTYVVTMTLTGFASLKREGVELAGTFTAAINAELRVGGIEETVVIRGESPIVNTQSAIRQDVLSRTVVTEIPAARNIANVVTLVPGVVVSGTVDVGGLKDAGQVTDFSAQGGRGDDGHIKLDGMEAGGPVGGAGLNQGGGGSTYYKPDVGNVQEVVVTTGGLGEAETGGPQINIVPRSGGNTPSGSFFLNFANGGMQGDNVTDELRAQNANGVASEDLDSTHDITGAFGGPIKRDKVWFFVTARHQVTEKKVGLMFYNKNAGNPNAFLYEPDTSRPAYTDSRLSGTSARLTWQATARQKFSLHFDEQSLKDHHNLGGTPTSSPEADSTLDAYPQHLVQVSWQAPWTNRLLLDAGFASSVYDYGGREREGNNTRNLVRINDTGVQGGLTGITYRSMNFQENYAFAPRWRASAAYVTGAHSMKVGYEGRKQYSDTNSYQNTQDITYTFRNGVPASLTLLGSNPLTGSIVTHSEALYAQEQWTLGRLTLQGGLRYDYTSSYYPEQRFGGTKYHPAVFVFPEDTTGGITGFNDLNTRVSVAYDVFGDGKTALKFHAGRYLDTASASGRYQLGNPISRIQATVGRSWTDSDRDFNPDCDLLNPAAQNNTAVGGDICGAWNNTTFGQEVFTTTYDPDMFRGWFTRPMEWRLGLGIQQQILPRLSVEAGLHRRWIDKWTLIHNRAAGHSDFSPYSYQSPVDPRLGDVSGRLIGDLWDINPDKFGQFDNFTRLENNVPNVNRKDLWHGADFQVSSRFDNSLTMRFGGQVWAEGSDWCSYIDEGYYGTGIPQGPSKRNCDTFTDLQFQLQGLATYIIPRIEVQVSGTVLSRPGPAKSANVQVPAATIAASLGRPVSGNPSTVTINLFDTNEAFYPQITVVDMRVSKILRFRGIRANLGVDIYNLMNSSAGQTYNNTYSVTTPETWGTPNSILAARFAKLALQFDF